MKNKVDLPKTLLEHIPWDKKVNPIWPASSFILHRNLARFPFPPKMRQDQMSQTLGIFQDALLKCPQLRNLQFLPAEALHPLSKEFLFEHFLCTHGFQNTLEGQAFLIDDSSRFLGKLNIEDHLLLQFVDCHGNWDESWNMISEIETAIGQMLDYAFSSKFGYLTADPGLCGTGLEIYVYLHVPALIHMHQLQEVLLKQKDEEVVAQGMEGTLEELVGDVLVLSNHYTLGLTEESLLRSVYSSAMKLMAAEKTLRTRIHQENNTEIKDLISRSYGLLAHSYQLQTKETLNALSFLKLGIDLEWVKGISDSKINEILLKSRRAHLAYAGQTPALDIQEGPHKRAEFLHEQLQGVTLIY
jgi:protein arginine kinase